MKPKNISKKRTEQINALEEVQDLKSRGWEFYACHSMCGRCSYGTKTITIPIWAIVPDTKQEKELTQNNPEYWKYYLAHEMAHAYAYEDHGTNMHHGPEFMEIFKILCPEHLQHFELHYKPRNAKAAGISKN